MDKVLILGAGMVVKPIVNYLLEHDIFVNLADIKLNKAQELIQNHKNGQAIQFSIDDNQHLSQLVSENDLVVSLLPYIFHVKVAKECIKHKKNMLTSSYVSSEMETLHAEAVDAGVLILNELGLDPGIDHMSAMRIIDKVHSEDGKILEFYSITGALPAHNSLDTPFAYKFSWSPKGVIVASNNDAEYLKDGKQVFIPTADLFKDTFTYDFPEVGELEVYPNRNSIQYRDIYGIPESKTVFRGTFRYKGWCRILDKMKAMNLFSNEKQNFEGKTYHEFVEMMLPDESDLSVYEKIQKQFAQESTLTIEALEFIGLFADEVLAYKETSAFEITSDRMISKMMLSEEADDMIAMQHVFLIENSLGKREVIKSSLLAYGNLKTDTAIAKTVALPAAIGVRNILNGNIRLKGVLRPVKPEIYNVILPELESLGIRMIEQYHLPESDNIV